MRLYSSSLPEPSSKNITTENLTSPLTTKSLLLPDEKIENGQEQHQTDTINDWKENPALNPEYVFDTWLVPKQHCNQVLREPLLQSQLASRFFDSLPLSHPTPKLVRSHDATHQLVLRNFPEEANEPSDEIAQWLLQHDIVDGPSYSIRLEPRHFATSHIFGVLGIPPLTSFEQIGHVIHLNLREHHQEYKELIGDILLECLRPIVRTVINKVGEVSGDFRTYEMELLAGENSTNVSLNERGVSLQFDLSKVYWSSRLGGERQRLAQEILKSGKPGETLVVADAFCGVGALCILLAQANQKNQTASSKVKVLANDWNPRAIEALKENTKRNRVSQYIDAKCGDAYDFMMDLGFGDQLPHHVVMNIPLDAPTFLTTLRWWKVPKKKADVVPRVHLYMFSRREGTRSAFDVAVDEVAHYLLPEASEPTVGRLQHLQSLGCDVKVREIRDVAPGKVVVCLSFSATSFLLRHVQGDFV